MFSDSESEDEGQPRGIFGLSIDRRYIESSGRLTFIERHDSARHLAILPAAVGCIELSNRKPSGVYPD